MPRLPTAFICHGGGPMPVVRPLQQGSLPAFLRSFGEQVKQASPSAVLVVSAHWEESTPSIVAAEHPSLLYDYYGFEEKAYALKLSAPGAPELAQEVHELLSAQGMQSRLEHVRGWDHGVFIPLLAMLHDKRTPVLQLSLLSSLDPAAHLALGRALVPLRERGVLVVGSGLSYHNMRGFSLSSKARSGAAGSQERSHAFRDWLSDTVRKPGPEREAGLQDWANAPAARDCHPREEHLLPLHVAAGAAGGDEAHVLHEDDVMGVGIVSYLFGEWPEGVAESA